MNVINLSYGHIEDSFFDSEYIKETIKKGSYNLDFSNYSIPGGKMELRESIAKNFSYNLLYKNSCTSVSTNLSFYILNKIFSKSVLAISPIYSNFHKQLVLDGISFFEESYDDFSKNVIDYKKYNDCLCVIVYPNNPTGELCSLEILEDNIKRMKENGITCVIDISWINSIYSGKNVVDIKDIAKFVNKYNSIILLGFTKIFGVTSIRCSGVLAQERIIDKFINLHDMLAVSCGQLDEYLVGEFIKKAPIYWDRVREDLKRKVKFVLKKIAESKLNIEYILPKSGIFLYFILDTPIDIGKTLSECKERGLLVYSSKDFENKACGFRISVNNSVEELDKGLEILFKSIENNII